MSKPVPLSSTNHAAKKKRAVWVEHNPKDVPANVQLALREALKLENVSTLQFDDFLWLIAQESNGKVNAKNPHSTARGLFQLLRNQYALNPRGEESFGNATEECQGGIRYVIGRYRTALAARQFWLSHHWY